MAEVLGSVVLRSEHWSAPRDNCWAKHLLLCWINPSLRGLSGGIRISVLALEQAAAGPLRLSEPLAAPGALLSAAGHGA